MPIFEYYKRDGLEPEKYAIRDLYYGSSFDDEEVEEALKETGWIRKAQFHKAISLHIGNLLTNGKIIARFNGRTKWGPRALGNRSILGDPRNLKIVNKINSNRTQRFLDALRTNYSRTPNERILAKRKISPLHDFSI